MKECKKCKNPKPLNEYYISNVNKKPIGVCKSCYKKRAATYNKKWVKNNPKKMEKYYKDFYSKNPHYIRDYVKEKRKDPLYKITMNMRIRLGNVIRKQNYTKRNHLHEVLGISWEEFKDYISSQFTKGMSWDNYGEWELDHIIPLSTAKTGEEVEKLFYYKNLQPLWRSDNRKKSNKL